MKSITLRLDKDLWERLHIVATVSRVTVTQVVRDAIEQQLRVRHG